MLNSKLSRLLLCLIQNYKVAIYASILVFLFFLNFAIKLQIDASSDSLVADNNDVFKSYENIVKTYNDGEFLLLAYTPKSGDIFSKDSIDNINDIVKQVSGLESVKSTISIVNAPLLKSIKGLSLQDNIKANATLLSKEIDVDTAHKELLNNPFFKDNIVSKDSKTAGIVVFLKNGVDYSNDIDILKNIKDKYVEELYIGGLPLIISDVIYYIKSDLVIYTLLLGLVLVMIVWLFFRSAVFVCLCAFSCLFVLIVSSGLFSVLGYKITIVSSNYISLLFIINISLLIHLIVSYLELRNRFPKSNKARLVLATILRKLKPSFYAIATTMIGFLGLIFSSIIPIVNLGIVMAIGVIVSLISTFVLFVIFLMVMKLDRNITISLFGTKILDVASKIAINNKRTIYIVSIVCVIFSSYGIRNLGVENSFINYFKNGSDIKDGLLTIDNNLGGTIPLEVIVKFKDKKEVNTDPKDEFEEEFLDLGKKDIYWFDEEKLRIARMTHEYFAKNKYIGSILSLHSVSLLLEMLELRPDGFAFSFLYNNLDENLKSQLFYPYSNIQNNELRFVMRVFDSDPTLKRNEFISQINAGLHDLLQNENVEFEVNGLMVLYNDLLQSLVSSQLDTLFFVVFIIFALFLLVFRSIKFSIIALIVNMVPLCIVFGVLGVIGISLDIMTVTVAAISLGMGVDHAIHYIVRYKEEIAINSKEIAIINSHRSIGSAMYYTAVIIIVGFFIMVSSSFVPTIYFGIITSVVMVLMLMSSLILLPRLLLLVR